MRLVFRFFYFIISLILISCSGDSPDEIPEPEKPLNKAPSSPNLISPQNNLACTYSTMNFEWEPSTDPEGTKVNYELEVSYRQDFEELHKFTSTSNTSVSLSLEKGSTYYWRVFSRDMEGAKSDPFEVRSFYTEPDLTYNSIPQNPNSEKPENNSTVDITTSLLEWTSTDEDGDSLKFDVYFGTTIPPPLVREDMEASSLEVDLSEETSYYWKIVAKDSKGAKAIGPIWNFSIH